MSGTRPRAMLGVSASPNISCSRTASTGDSPDRHSRSAPRPARHLDVRRRLSVERLSLLPGAGRPAAAPRSRSRGRPARASRVRVWRQPRIEPLEQRRIRHIGPRPDRPDAETRAAPQAHEPRPRNRGRAPPAEPFAERMRGPARGRDRQQPLAQHDGAKPRCAGPRPAPQRRSRSLLLDRDLRPDAPRFLPRHRRREEDPALGAAIVELHRHDQFRIASACGSASTRRGRCGAGSARCRRGAARCGRDRRVPGAARRQCCSTRRDAELASQRPRWVRIRSTDSGATRAPARTAARSAAPAGPAGAHIGIGGSALAAQDVALLQQRRELSGLRSRSSARARSACAQAGGAGSVASRLPCAVIRPWSSIASRAREAAAAPGPGARRAGRRASASSGAHPAAARSSASGARSASRISGS